jgi:uncharacterized protein
MGRAIILPLAITQADLVLLPRVIQAKEVWTTEAVLTEVANALSSSHRDLAVQLIESYYQTPNITVVTVDTLLFIKGLELYKNR